MKFLKNLIARLFAPAPVAHHATRPLSPQSAVRFALAKPRPTKVYRSRTARDADRAALLALFAQFDGPLATAWIAKRLKCNPQYITDDCRALMRDGLITKPKAGFWQVAK